MSEGRCCCGRYTVSQDEDYIMNDTRHQLLGKKQSYRPFCGPTYRHALEEKDAEIESLKAELLKESQSLRTRAEQAEVELGGIRGIMATYGRIEDTAENLVRKMCKDFDECLDRLEKAEARVEKAKVWLLEPFGEIEPEQYRRLQVLSEILRK